LGRYQRESDDDDVGEDKNLHVSPLPPWTAGRVGGLHRRFGKREDLFCHRQRFPPLSFAGSYER
jgi:hypothetical protein